MVECLHFEITRRPQGVMQVSPDSGHGGHSLRATVRWRLPNWWFAGADLALDGVRKAAPHNNSRAVSRAAEYGGLPPSNAREDCASIGGHNQAVCWILRKKTSKDATLMRVLRDLWYLNCAATSGSFLQVVARNRAKKKTFLSSNVFICRVVQAKTHKKKHCLHPISKTNFLARETRDLIIISSQILRWYGSIMERDLHPLHSQSVDVQSERSSLDLPSSVRV